MNIRRKKRKKTEKEKKNSFFVLHKTDQNMDIKNFIFILSWRGRKGKMPHFEKKGQ